MHSVHKLSLILALAILFLGMNAQPSGRASLEMRKEALFLGGRLHWPSTGLCKEVGTA
jgi:hypothetical protein